MTSYFQEQENREGRISSWSRMDLWQAISLYCLLPSNGPFVGVYPELTDFNVFEPFRSRGIGNQLLEEAEKESGYYQRLLL